MVKSTALLSATIFISGCVGPPAGITSSGAGEIHLGDVAKAGSYSTQRYADGRPLEGFMFEKDAIFAAVDGGPFVMWGMDHPGLPAPPEIREEALRLAHTGHLRFSMLVVSGGSLATDRGIKVGTGYAALKNAYPKLELKSLPPLWENPTCAVHEDNLWFFLNGCRVEGDAPKVDSAAQVIRIVVHRTGGKF